MKPTKKQLMLLEYALEHTDSGLAIDYVNLDKRNNFKATIYDYTMLLAYVKEMLIKFDKNDRKSIKRYYE